MSELAPGPHWTAPSGTRARVLAVLGAALSTALGVAALAVAQAAPPPLVREPASGLDVLVPASDVLLACPGPPTSYAPSDEDEGGAALATSLRVVSLPAPVTGQAAPQAPQAPAAGTPSLVLGPLADAADTDAADTDAADTDAADGQDVAEEEVAPVLGDALTPDGAALAAASGADARGVVADPVAGAEPLVAGSSVALTGTGDLRGLAASPCVATADEAWLVGGSTLVGDSTRLVLANPGPTPATATATVLTGAGGGGQPQGRVVAVPEISLAPGEQRAVLLEGVAPGAASLAVGVRSEGADVAAWLVTTSLRGLVPQGIDVVTPGEAPGPRQVVPAVVVQRGDSPPLLRLAAPGPVPVVARWEVSGPGGPVVLDGATLAATVPAGGVVDVPLTGLSSGAHTVVVQGDGPLVAAAGLHSSGDPALAGDQAWTGAARPLTGPVLVAVPQASGTDSELVLHAPLPADGTSPPEPVAAVTVLDAEGELHPADDVPLGSGASVALDVAELVRASGAGEPVALLLTAPEGAGVAAALRTGVAADGGARLLSSHAVAPPPASTGALAVRLRGAP